MVQNFNLSSLMWLIWPYFMLYESINSVNAVNLLFFFCATVIFINEKHQPQKVKNNTWNLHFNLNNSCIFLSGADNTQMTSYTQSCKFASIQWHIGKTGASCHTLVIFFCIDPYLIPPKKRYRSWNRLWPFWQQHFLCLITK